MSSLASTNPSPTAQKGRINLLMFPRAHRLPKTKAARGRRTTWCKGSIRPSSRALRYFRALHSRKGTKTWARLGTNCLLCLVRLGVSEHGLVATLKKACEAVTAVNDPTKKKKKRKKRSMPCLRPRSQWFCVCSSRLTISTCPGAVRVSWPQAPPIRGWCWCYSGKFGTGVQRFAANITVHYHI